VDRTSPPPEIPAIAEAEDAEGVVVAVRKARPRSHNSQGSSVMLRDAVRDRNRENGSIAQR